MKFIYDGLEARAKTIGAKAMNLIRMSELGVEVPAFFCIPFGFFDDVFDENKDIIKNVLKSIDFEDEVSIKTASKQIQTILEKTHIPDEFEREISEYLHKNFQKTKTFSIRSSSLIEDGCSHTFAGQFDTYLNIDKDEVSASIFRCFASLYSPNALKYANICGIDFSDYKMSVIVQEMIASDTSGVIFSSNPQGLLNETVIINGKGTGDLIVEDKVPVTTYYYNKTDKHYYYETTEQAPVLSNTWIERLIDSSAKIQHDFGEYIDIEYAIEDDMLYILQVRPITTLSGGKLTVLDNSNIVESYPDITLPLTNSFIREAYAGVFRNAVYIATKSKKIVKANSNVFENMLGYVNGRVYYKISNWYALIKCLPFHKKIIPVWQDMLGVNEQSLTEDTAKISFLGRAKTNINFTRALLRTPKSMKRLEADFDAVNDWFQKVYHENLSKEELCSLYDELRKRILSKWGITLINDMYAFVFTGLLKGALKKTKRENCEDRANGYISGMSNIESLKPVKELIRIVNLIVKENKIDDLKALKDDADATVFLRKEGDIQTQINYYIRLFGDRCPEELKLESRTFRTSPILLIHQLIAYADDPLKLASMTEAFEKENNPLNIASDFGFIKRKYIRFLSRRAMLGIKNRESSRLNRSRIYGMIRAMFLDYARQLHQNGIIDNTYDIFYLTTEEILKDTMRVDMKLKEIIATRKREFALYDKLPVYSRLNFAGLEWSKRHANVNSTPIKESFDRITGTPCSSGIVTGEVLIVSNPNDVKSASDKILVTKMTDPGWVFLLTTAKGIIAEKGSLLSHTAIISRELKVPAIVGAANVTTLLKTGDIVKMDAGSGTVEKVSG